MTDVMTYDEAHYIDCGDSETPDIELATVMTDITENSNPTESEKQYTVNKAKTVKVTGFNNSFDITMDFVKTEPVFEKFYAIFRDRKVGTDAQVIHYIVELWNKVGSEGTSYKARKITQTVSIASATNVPGEQKTMTGALKGGDFIDGTFDTSTKAFTATV